MQFIVKILRVWMLVAGLLLGTLASVVTPAQAGATAQRSSAYACTAPTPYTGTGADVAALQPVVDNFRNAIGPLNAPHPLNHTEGRREINWDGAPDAISAPNAFPGDFFNAGVFPRARGAEFTTPGTGFQLSATAASGQGIEFDNIDPAFSAEFSVFSPERLFTAIGSNIVDVHFFSPADQTTPALVDSFGVVFTDVDRANATKLDFYDVDNNLVYTLYAPAQAGQESLSLAGAKFSTACIGRVRITNGNLALAPGVYDSNSYDLVVMDDFIYGEPRPITSCGAPTSYTAAAADAAGLEASLNIFRAALGDLNAPQPANQPDGRREINWDGAPDAISAPNAFPGDFFNGNAAPRARGIEFTTPGTGFQLSVTAASGQGIEFANIDASYSAEFNAFSPERLFAAIGSNVVEARFFTPADQTTRALVDGFGAVFTDVELPNVTAIEFFDSAENLVFKLGVPAFTGGSQESFSFAGLAYGKNCIGRVRLINGNTALAAGTLDQPEEDVDLVVMDDFIYGEPQANGLSHWIYLPQLKR